MEGMTGQRLVALSRDEFLAKWPQLVGEVPWEHLVHLKQMAIQEVWFCFFQFIQFFINSRFFELIFCSEIFAGYFQKKYFLRNVSTKIFQIKTEPDEVFQVKPFNSVKSRERANSEPQFEPPIKKEPASSRAERS